MIRFYFRWGDEEKVTVMERNDTPWLGNSKIWKKNVVVKLYEYKLYGSFEFILFFFLMN